MNYQEFSDIVGRRARFVTPHDVSRAIAATLTTLAECLPAGRLKNLSERLPRELALYLRRGADVQEFSVHEFFERVSERTHKEKSVAIQQAWAVLSVVEQQLSLDEMNEMRSELPRQYERLFEFAV
jgi:uncharacterized protein (DUF2267 family)